MKRLAGLLPLCIACSIGSAHAQDAAPPAGTLVIDRLHLGMSRSEIRKLYHYKPIPFGKCGGMLDAGYRDDALVRADFKPGPYDNERKKCGDVVKALLTDRFGPPTKTEHEPKNIGGGGTTKGGVTGLLNQLGKTESAYILILEWTVDDMKVRFRFDEAWPSYWEGYFEKRKP